VAPSCLEGPHLVLAWPVIVPTSGNAVLHTVGLNEILHVPFPQGVVEVRA
jgi:hypothetical protein